MAILSASTQISSLLAALFFLLQVAALSNPLPEPCIGPACANPAGKLDYQDFSVIRRVSDGRYFRFSKSNSSGDGLTVATAPAFRGRWTYQYTILNTLKDPIVTNRADANVWAPDVKYVNETYYLFYSVFQPSRGFDLCVATSKTMGEHDWTDHGSMGVPVSPSSEYVRLDSNLVASTSDPSGVAAAYMVFDSYNTGLFGVPVSKDLLKGVGKPKMLTADEYVSGKKHNRTEGGYFLNHGNYTYLFYSQGNCCPGIAPNPNATTQAGVYKTFVCRSASGPSGPFVDVNGHSCDKRAPGIGTVFLENREDLQVYAPGSVGVLRSPEEGGLVMWYQYYNLTANPKVGLQFGWNHLQFNETGWPELVARRS